MGGQFFAWLSGYPSCSHLTGHFFILSDDFSPSLVSEFWSALVSLVHRLFLLLFFKIDFHLLNVLIQSHSFK
jgi:hypothetical protein